MVSQGYSQSYTSLAVWTFETSKPVNAGPHVAESGLFASTSYASTNTGGAVTNPTGEGSNESFATDGWAIGEYFQFSAPTLGYTGISLRFDQRSSGTGPRTFDVYYSTNGSSFERFSSYTVGGSSFSEHTVNLASISGLDNQSNIYFRMVLTSNEGASGGTVQGGGTSRIDNVTIRALSTVPEPSSMLLGAIGVMMLLKRRI